MELDKKINPEEENLVLEDDGFEIPDLSPKKKKNFLNSRKFKFGTMATVITAIFLVVLVLLNVVATLLLERYPLTIDLNSDKRFSLTQQSIDYLGELDQDVRIHVCAEEALFESVSEYYKQAYEVITKYAQYSDRITVDFVDVLSNPTFAQKYSDYSLTTGDIIVESDLRSKKLTSTDLFNIETTDYGYTQTVTSSKAEQAMTGAIMYVTDNDPTTVGLLTLDNTVDVSGYISLLESNNYVVQEINFLTEEIPSGMEFVVLPQPGFDLTAEQITKLESYLTNGEEYGKGLVFVASGERTVEARLANFLADWGIAIGPEVVAETDVNRVYTELVMFLANVTDSELQDAMSTDGSTILAAYSRPVNVLFEENGNRTTKVLLNTNDTAILIPEEIPEDFDYTTQPQSAQNLVVLGTRSVYDASGYKDSYVLAYGSELMLYSSILQEGIWNNADFAITLTNSLSGKAEDTITITPINFDSKTIEITQAQANVFLVILVILVPLAILATALVIYLRRRHL